MLIVSADMCGCCRSQWPRLTKQLGQCGYLAYSMPAMLLPQTLTACTCVDTLLDGSQQDADNNTRMTLCKTSWMMNYVCRFSSFILGFSRCWKLLRVVHASLCGGATKSWHSRRIVRALRLPLVLRKLCDSKTVRFAGATPCHPIQYLCIHFACLG